ncbi:hypothetical protein Pelo_7033 [Pelomyxa schiedti]|nr:hypothetical protein Pelo_7033 [Pelomyxa schiedti]
MGAANQPQHTSSTAPPQAGPGTTAGSTSASTPPPSDPTTTQLTKQLQDQVLAEIALKASAGPTASSTSASHTPTSPKTALSSSKPIPAPATPTATATAAPPTWVEENDGKLTELGMELRDFVSSFSFVRLPNAFEKPMFYAYVIEPLKSYISNIISNKLSALRVSKIFTERMYLKFIHKVIVEYFSIQEHVDVRAII